MRSRGCRRRSYPMRPPGQQVAADVVFRLRQAEFRAKPPGARVLLSWWPDGNGIRVQSPSHRPGPSHGLRRQQAWSRSEEHTSELQSLMRISYAVFCLKKKKYISKYMKI